MGVQEQIKKFDGNDYGVKAVVVFGKDGDDAVTPVTIHGGAMTSTPADDLTMSEFGERRVATPGNRADVEFWLDNAPLLTDDISTGGGTATFDPVARSVTLAVNNATVGTVAGRRLHYYVPYTPGSGQEIDLTGTLNPVNHPGHAEVFLRSSVTGVTTLQTIPQSQWLDATAGVNWNFSQIFRISFQSLRVGRIQFSLVRNGLAVKVAEINNDNVRATGYWQYANLPLYWRIVNEASNTVTEFGYGDAENGIGFRYVASTLNATATARAICGTVKSQGGVPLLNMPGFPFATPRMTAGVTVAATLVPIISIRVASLYKGLENRQLVIPTGYGVETNNPIDYTILFNPVLTTPSWQAVNATYSGVEYDVAATAVSGGIAIEQDFLGAGTNARIGEDGILGKVVMALGGSTADVLTIAATRSTAQSASVRAILRWKEVR